MIGFDVDRRCHNRVEPDAFVADAFFIGIVKKFGGNSATFIGITG